MKAKEVSHQGLIQLELRTRERLDAWTGSVLKMKVLL